MIIAVCMRKYSVIQSVPSKKKVSPPARGPDDCLDVIEVTMQGGAPGRGQPVYGLRTPAFEGFGAAEVAGFLELAGVCAQVPIAHLEQRLHLAERELVAHRKRAHHAEPYTLVYQAV